MATVRFHELVPVSWLINRSLLKQMVLELFRRENKKIHELHIVFCDDDFLLSINQEFLQHNDLTDIITFELSDTNVTDGEIYISVPRVVENAVLNRVHRTEELQRVLFHGCLHLCGYKDKLKKDIKAMRVKEAEYLKRYQTRRST